MQVTATDGAPMPGMDIELLEQKAEEVADVLRALANKRRLLILCKLAEQGEANVSSLAEAVGLSQSALSQHLARMRAEAIVSTRRESQTIFYRIADQRIAAIMGALYRTYCAPGS